MVAKEGDISGGIPFNFLKSKKIKDFDKLSGKASLIVREI
jgi:hypothetical protein